MTTQLDAVLAPLGFRRRAATWNRRRLELTDVIDLQLDKSGSTFTMNAGVLERTAFESTWNKPVADWVREPDCTVRTRLGQLIDGHDRWWPMDGATNLAEISTLVVTLAVPFLDEIETTKDVVRRLEESRGVRNLVPPETVYLAILRQSLGDNAGACDLLHRYRAKARGLWLPKVDELISRFQC